jgi:glyceraldehyde 3-phosphate dehydrogenase
LSATDLECLLCTTQALVPLIDTLDKAFGVTSAMMTGDSAVVTADQTVLDQVRSKTQRA